MSDKHSKKHKKQQLVQKHRHQQQITQMDADLSRNRDLDLEREEELRDAALASGRLAEKQSAGQPVWSAKMQMIRDKNTGRRQMAKERWNRFAGTEGGGGRGL
ncbi:MAG: hypothetical protein ACOYNL_06435 [Rickettsiales bacterium]